MKKGLLFFTLLFAGFQVALAQNMQVSGKVTYADDGQPVIGATIRVEGSTSVAALSDVHGAYKLSVPASSSKVLIASFSGLKDATATVTSNNQVIDFVLETDAQQIESVQVMGYGSARKIGTVVGSVQQVTSKTLENRPTASVLDALQGKVAGLQVYTSSGEPSELQSVRLHGVGSLGTSSTPLYVVDGIPVSASNIQSMNPNDFESVTVMKDASATSIYGSRAANGVIYITTKRGSRGKASITLRGQYGVSTQANKQFYDQFMNTNELWDFWKANDFYAEKQYEDWTAAGLDKNNTDWFRFYQKEWAPAYQGDISISGGNEKTTYYVSGSMFHQDGTAAKSYYDRYTFRSNVDSKVNDWFSFGVNVQLSYDQRNTNANYGTNNLNGGLSYLFQPFYSPYYEENGVKKEYWDDRMAGVGVYNPKYAAEKLPMEYNTYGTTSSAYIVLEPIKNFKITSRGGINFEYIDRTYKQMPSYAGAPGNGTLQRATDNSLNATITNTLEYSFQLAPKHKLTILAGQEGISFNSNYYAAKTAGLTDDRLMQLGFGKQETYTESSSSSAYNFLSFFGRLSYEFSDRVFVDATVRNDQSSRFGPDNRSATFWSVGARWNLKKEFLEQSSTISDLTFKASYGSQGNSEIGNYTWQQQIGIATRYNQSDGWAIANPGNRNLSWETQYKLTVGATINLWDRLNIEVEYYLRTTDNMLMDVPLPGTSGFEEIKRNVGAMQNQGIDININYDILREKDYYLNVGVAFNYNEEKVTELFDGLNEWTVPNTGVTYVVGKPVMYYYPIYAGVNPETGAMRWYKPGESIHTTNKDINNTTEVFDEAYLNQNTGNRRFAPISGGFSIGGGWKGISLQADFSFVIGKTLISNDRYFSENPAGFYGYNTSKNVLDYWKKPGDQTMYPNWAEGPVMQFDTHLMEDASFMRLKNLALSYTLPSKVFGKGKVISGLKFTASARNLFTITQFKGIDPEVDSNLSIGAIPNTTQFMFGVELVF